MIIKISNNGRQTNIPETDAEKAYYGEPVIEERPVAKQMDEVQIQEKAPEVETVEAVEPVESVEQIEVPEEIVPFEFEEDDEDEEFVSVELMPEEEDEPVELVEDEEEFSKTRIEIELMLKADLEELADRCGVDNIGLKSEIKDRILAYGEKNNWFE